MTHLLEQYSETPTPSLTNTWVLLKLGRERERECKAMPLNNNKCVTCFFIRTYYAIFLIGQFKNVVSILVLLSILLISDNGRD